MNDSNEWRQTRITNRDKFEKYSKDYEKISNDIFLESTKVLITLNTALLAFTSPIITGKILTGDEILKTLIVIVWVLLSGSIVAGIIELIVEHYFFDRQSNLNSIIATIFNNADENEDGIARAFNESGIELQKNFVSQSCPIPYFLQISFFVIALIILIIIFVGIL